MRLQAWLTRRSRFAAALVSAVCVLAAGAGATGAGAVALPVRATVTTLATFTTPGTYTWTVPPGVKTVTFDVVGASGGDLDQVNHGVRTVLAAGGAGGEAKAKLGVKPGEVFEIVVGGQGGVATEGVGGGAGGFNGGGAGAGLLPPGAGGGGGTDVRIGGRGDECATVENCDLSYRIIVAGGGGGGGEDGNFTSGGDGGVGGGVAGGTGVGDGAGAGGLQEGPSLCNGCTKGMFGIGADAGAHSNGGGAGGGWWGGNSLYFGGGGGSGFITQLAKTSSFPAPTHIGDGEVIITTKA
jgi:glycine rich protein